MFRRLGIFEILVPLFAESRTHLAVLGSGFLLIALLIFVFPELVAYFVATIFLWIGIVFLAVALQERPVRKRRTHFHDEYFEIL